MPAIIACSVCRTILAPGAQSCPGCGLPLVAQAVPVVQRPPSIWPVILGVIAVFVIGIWIIGAIERPIQEKKQREFSSALHSDFVNGKLDTPEKFIARCGAPRTRKGSTLYYNLGSSHPETYEEALADLAVAFPHNAPPTYTIDGVRQDRAPTFNSDGDATSLGKFHDTFQPAEMSFVEQFCAANAVH
jgi:hypothetical protein